MSRSPEPTPPAELIRRHQRALWRWLRFLGADGPTAEDLVQETFLVVLRGPFEDRGPAATSAWLRAVARNLFLKDRRREARAAAALEEAEAVWLRFRAEDEENGLKDALRACLEELPERGRRVLGLRYEDGWSRARIARELSLGEEGVKSLLARLRKALRACVERRLWA